MNPYATDPDPPPPRYLGYLRATGGFHTPCTFDVEFVEELEELLETYRKDYGLKLQLSRRADGLHATQLVRERTGTGDELVLLLVNGIPLPGEKRPGQKKMPLRG